eukprot:1555544-Rhodomonas_salina.3
MGMPCGLTTAATWLSSKSTAISGTFLSLPASRSCLRKGDLPLAYTTTLSPPNTGVSVLPISSPTPTSFLLTAHRAADSDGKSAGKRACRIGASLASPPSAVPATPWENPQGHPPAAAAPSSGCGGPDQAVQTKCAGQGARLHPLYCEYRRLRRGARAPVVSSESGPRSRAGRKRKGGDECSIGFDSDSADSEGCQEAGGGAWHNLTP